MLPCLFHTYSAVPLPCFFASYFLRPRHSTVGERHGMCEFTCAVSRQPVGCHDEFHEGWSSLLGGGLELGMLSTSAFRDFPNTDRVKI